MCALSENGREVLELLSNSEPEGEDRDSDLEVIEALQRTFRSSSAIPLSSACFALIFKLALMRNLVAGDNFHDHTSGSSGTSALSGVYYTLIFDHAD